MDAEDGRDMTIETVDILIVGAGLSGIGAAVHLKQQCPNQRVAILEARERLGGTWDLFRYPGIRSDSDMHTMGYDFKPWRSKKAIADGPSILAYLKETAEQYEVEALIRYQHQVTAADWRSEEGMWVVTIRTPAGSQRLRCRILYLCAGYYSYEGGYSPEFPRQERFEGRIVHPQQWPENLDYRGKRVVIIGSGATAITLLPSMSDKAAHVTMLQRSPTYLFAWPDTDRIANTLNKVLPAGLAYTLTRTKNILMQQYFYGVSQRHPERAKRRLIDEVRKRLGADFDVDKHFTPTYNPWQQRLCLTPNGDLFDALNAGKASVVTDQIEHFTESGIQLKSGQHLDADLIVTATGLNLVLFGGIAVSLDGQPVDVPSRWSYKGVGVSGIPNFFLCFGYINASWTLRADLVSRYVCRVLQHMEATGNTQCTPTLRETDQDMVENSWTDDFNPGYIERFRHQLPKQGDRVPWTNKQNLAHDKRYLGREAVDDGVLLFSRSSQR